MPEPKVLVLGPPAALFEPTAVAVEGAGPGDVKWDAMKCKACGWIVTVSDASKVPAHECSGLRETEREPEAPEVTPEPGLRYPGLPEERPPRKPRV